MKPRKKR